MKSQHIKYVKIFSFIMLGILILLNLSSVGSILALDIYLGKANDAIPGFSTETKDTFSRYFDLNIVSAVFDIVLLLNSTALILLVSIKRRFKLVTDIALYSFCVFATTRSMIYVGLITGH